MALFLINSVIHKFFLPIYEKPDNEKMAGETYPGENISKHMENILSYAVYNSTLVLSHICHFKAKPYNYCKSLNISGVEFSRFNENNILVHFNFGVHDILLLRQ